jgi:hypothetical protein
MHRAITALTLALLALLTGPACDDTASPDPWLELGSSASPTRFAPLEDGAEVPITYGLQGGYHIWGSLRGDHFNPDPVRMKFTLYLGEDVIGGSDYSDALRRPEADGPFEYGGVTVFIYDNFPPERIEGQNVRMTLELTAGGLVLNDERTVIPRCCE